MSVVPFSFRRVWLIAHNTLLEAVRQKLVASLVLLAFALIVGAQWLRDFNFGAPELRFLADCGLGALAFFGATLAITATAQLFFSEVESRTVLTLLAKPVSRAEFVLGKYFGVVVLLAGFCVLLTGLLGGVLWSREAELAREFPDTFVAGAAVSYGTLALAGALHGLKLAVLAAFVLLVASFAQSQLFTVAMGFGILVIGHLQAIAHDAYGRAASGGANAFGVALTSVFPNFQLFTLADSLAPADTPAWGQVLRVVWYALGYIALAGGLAVFSFRHREI